MAVKASRERFLLKELWAVLSLAGGVFLALCLISYDPADPGVNVVSNIQTVSNLGGLVGAYLADFLFSILGISAYIVAGLFFLVSAMLFMGRSMSLSPYRLAAYGVMLGCAATILHLRFGTVLLHGQPIEAGGVVGGLIGGVSARYVNVVGGYVIATAVFFLAFVYATQLSFISVVKFFASVVVISAMHAWQFLVILWARCVKHAPKLWKKMLERIATWRESRAKNAAADRAARASAPAATSARAVRINRTTVGATAEESDDDVDAPSRKNATKKLDDAEDDDDDDGDELDADDESDSAEDNDDADDNPTSEKNEDADDAHDPTSDADASAIAAKSRVNTNTATHPSTTNDDIDPTAPKITPRADLMSRQRMALRQLEIARISKDYTFPPLSLLDTGDQKRIDIDEKSLRDNARTLEGKLLEYGIQGRVVEIHPGPVVTMYEFEPAAGVKVNKIVSVEDDLSVSLGGRSVRIVPHLPGKAAVGIEVPNHERETVWLKQIIGDAKFRKIASKIPLAMGKNIEGHPVIADLAKMPHLLVAGATGAGKSVAINAMICSILYKATPAEVRMIMVDPKMLELSVYDGIPHLLLPVVTKPKQAILALQWAVREMERRYVLLSAAAVRNIATYNEQIDNGALDIVSELEVEDRKLADPECVCHTGKLPYLVIIVDEMADLMMVAGRDIEEAIIRLAQMARAAGIHLIIATQRPSVDVITGLIKANFPSRVAFKVSSKHDARTIIDTVGAEQLLGMGDMLFLGPGSTSLVRLHGAFITEDEIEKIVSHIKTQGTPQYDERILQAPAASGEAEGEAQPEDELYDQAVRIVTETGQASISMVQRRLRIGYNRAARLIERMEGAGIVGPASGSKPREILVQSH